MLEALLVVMNQLRIIILLHSSSWLSWLAAYLLLWVSLSALIISNLPMNIVEDLKA